MTFKYKRKRIIRDKAPHFLYLILMAYFLINFNFLNGDIFKITLFISLFIFSFYKPIKTSILKWRKPAIILSQPQLELPLLKLTVPWEEVSSLTYNIGFTEYFLHIELKTKDVIYNQNKIITYYKKFLVWFNDGPIKINLEELEGEPKANFDAILEYKNQIEDP